MYRRADHEWELVNNIIKRVNRTVAESFVNINHLYAKIKLYMLDVVHSN